MEIKKIFIVGSGLMGGGIAQVCAAAGYQVKMHDVKEEFVEKGLENIKSSLGKFLSKEKITQEQHDAALGNISTTTRLEDAADCDLTCEAVFENLDVKARVFGELDRTCAEGVVLATNTSAIPVSSIAAATSRPEAVIGMHFFSPVPLMKLCELVRGFKTSDDTLQSARTFAEAVGKTCVVVNRDVAGFVTTRLISALAMEAVRLVESGVATPEDVDTACRLGFGHPMGPLETIDMTGVDIMLNATTNIYEETQDEKFAAPELLRRMVAAGDLGRKSGQGFYPY